jgi:putative transposase
LGIKDFIVCSDGKTFKNIKIKRNNEKKLVKLNRQLSKKTNGSKNKNKCRKKLAKYHEHLNTQRKELAVKNSRTKRKIRKIRKRIK